MPSFSQLLKLAVTLFLLVMAIFIIRYVMNSTTDNLNNSLSSSLTMDGNDTVQDYIGAKESRKQNFLKHLCEEGACLTARDWECGFQNGALQDVQDCFEDRILIETPYKKLDLLRKHCGRKYMVFSGNYGEKKDCINYEPEPLD